MEYINELILSQLTHEQPGAMQHEMPAHRALSAEMDARRAMANHNEQMMRGMSGEMDARRAAMNEQMMREHDGALQAVVVGWLKAPPRLNA